LKRGLVGGLENPMKRHGRSLPFGAAFVGVIQHAAFLGKKQRVVQ
jgi:hypothetical protein